METEGGIREARDESLLRVVADAKLVKVIATAGKDFMGEWSKSTKECIDALSENFSGLLTGKHTVVVTPHVPKEDVTALQDELEKIETHYTPQMCRQEHLSKVPDLCVFMMSHVSLTPYSFAFYKCSDARCCRITRTPSQFQVLAKYAKTTHTTSRQ